MSYFLKLTSDKIYYNAPFEVNVIQLNNNLYSDKDWIGIYKKSEVANGATTAPSGSVYSIYYAYPKDLGTKFAINNTEIVYNNVAGENSPRSDWADFANGLPVGEYSILYLYNDGYTILDRVDIKVVEEETTSSAISNLCLSLDKTIFKVGEAVNITIDIDHSKDWIGLYPQSQTPSASYGYGAILWTYIENPSSPVNMSIVTNDEANNTKVYYRDFVRQMDDLYDCGNSRYDFSYTYKNFLNADVLPLGDYKICLFINDSYEVLQEEKITIADGFQFAIDAFSVDGKDYYPKDSAGNMIPLMGKDIAHAWVPKIKFKKEIQLSGWITNKNGKYSCYYGEDYSYDIYYYRVNSGDWKSTTTYVQSRTGLEPAGVNYVQPGLYNTFEGPVYYNTYYNYQSAGFLNLTIPAEGMFNEKNIVEVAARDYNGNYIVFFVFENLYGSSYTIDYDPGSIYPEKIPSKDSVKYLCAADLPQLKSDNGEFLGWFYEENLGKPAQPGQLLTKNVKLRALWKTVKYDKLVFESDLVASDYENNNPTSKAYIKNRPFYEYYDDEELVIFQGEVNSSIVDKVKIYDTTYDLNFCYLNADAWNTLTINDEECKYAFMPGTYTLYINNLKCVTDIPTAMMAVSVDFYSAGDFVARMYADIKDMNSRLILYINDLPNKTYSIRIEHNVKNRFCIERSSIEPDNRIPPSEPYYFGDTAHGDSFFATDHFYIRDGHNYYQSYNVLAKITNRFVDEHGYIYHILEGDNGKIYTISMIPTISQYGGFSLYVMNVSLNKNDYGYQNGEYRYYTGFGLAWPQSSPTSPTKKIKTIDPKFLPNNIYDTANQAYNKANSAYSLAQSAYSDMSYMTPFFGSAYLSNSSGKLSFNKLLGANSSTFKNKSSLRTTLEVLALQTADTDTFYNMYNVKEIIAPSLKYAGSYCFHNCSSLQKVNLNDLLYAGTDCFYDCSSLKEISLPNVLEIDTYCFERCTNLEKVELPKIKEIPYRSFYDCENLKEADFSNIEKIGNDAFYDACTYSDETHFSFPKVKEIGTYCFYRCYDLVTCELPELEAIPSRSFYCCWKLKKLDCPKVTTISGGYSIYEAKEVEEILLPNLTSISGKQAIYGCLKLKTLDLGLCDEITASSSSYPTVDLRASSLLENLILRKPVGVVYPLDSSRIQWPLNNVNPINVYVREDNLEMFEYAPQWAELVESGKIVFKTIEGSEFDI